MKVYSVKPGDKDIRCSDGRMIAADGEIAWGISDMRAAFLCRAILFDVLGNFEEATILTQRFKWRTVVKWDAGKPHAITENEVMAVVDDIRAVAKEMRPAVDRMQREKPMIVTDRPAPGQVYDSNPEIIPNAPPEKANGGN